MAAPADKDSPTMVTRISISGGQALVVDAIDGNIRAFSVPCDWKLTARSLCSLASCLRLPFVLLRSTIISIISH
jgi:hypothetical protein